MPLTSVAVVITGRPPTIPATRSASSLAPPRWPESSDITLSPRSSATMTAGSLSLPLRCGATARTAMPQEETKTSASASAKRAPVHSPSEAPKGSTPFFAYFSGAQAAPPKARAILRASSAPLSENAAACSFMFLLGGPAEAV